MTSLPRSRPLDRPPSKAAREYTVYGLYEAPFGPTGTTQTDQSALVGATNAFFQHYYDLQPNSEFPPGRDMVFTKIGFAISGISSMFLGGNQYVTGTIAADPNLTAKEGYGRTVIVGGGNDDIITGTIQGHDLIDGGGNNTLYWQVRDTRLPFRVDQL